LQTLADRNPANPTATGAALKVLITLPDTLTPIDCIALFGFSAAAYGGYVSVKGMDAAPAGGDWASYEHTASIYGENVWVPIASCAGGAGYTYHKYWLVYVAPLASAYLGEVAACLLEAPVVNFRWGRTAAQGFQTQSMRTIGGVEYRYQLSRHPVASHAVQWDGYLDAQGRRQILDWYDGTKGGLHPLVLIPDDADRTSRGVFYSRLATEFSDAQRFVDQHEASISFAEAVPYNEYDT
jgi:hypothetical protein